jgi:hypothetical protein
MDGYAANRLKTIAKWLFIPSCAVFLSGAAWLIAQAPCSDTGAYIVFTSVGLGGLAACLLSVRALLVRTGDAFLLAGVIAFYTVAMFFVGSGIALMLCRGV